MVLNTKYFCVTGGVASGIGKGLITSSLGRLFKELGFRVTAIKISPYLNEDASLLSPIENGEVFVLKDGSEVDLDLGNYERIMDLNLTSDNTITTGKVYRAVLKKERKGAYMGKTVQIIPHITNEIIASIKKVANTPIQTGDNRPTACQTPSSPCDDNLPHIVMIELGGTVGDVENMHFTEALRQLQYQIGNDNFITSLVSFLPTVSIVGEPKTKPTQQANKNLRALGLVESFIFARAENPVDLETRKKISAACNVKEENVISCENLKNPYQIAVDFAKNLIHKRILQEFKFFDKEQKETPEDTAFKRMIKKRVEDYENGSFNFMEKWENFVNFNSTVINGLKPLKIAIIGKYTKGSDSYLSIQKSLTHAAAHLKRSLEMVWVESSCLEKKNRNSDDEDNVRSFEENWEKLEKADGILVPGGFGIRGTDGIIEAINYARTGDCDSDKKNKKPFLGICFGFQLAVIEFARNVLGMKNATTEEFVVFGEMEKDKNLDLENDLVIINMPEASTKKLGGTMRLGEHEVHFSEEKIDQEHNKVWKLYGEKDVVYERHRHRFEVNPKIVPKLEEKGMIFVAQDTTGKRQEMFELKNSEHDYFVAAQFHPEFLSRVFKPSPLFVGFLEACAKNHGEN